MNEINTIIKFNLSGKGYITRWIGQKPQYHNYNVENYFPSARDQILGPNIAYSCDKIDLNTYFITTISRFLIPDEHGRLGLDLCHGILVNIKEALDKTRISEILVRLLKFHEDNYGILSLFLKKIAVNSSDGDLNDFLKLIDGSQEANALLRSSDKLFLSKITDLIKTSNSNLNIDTQFPWSKYLGIYALAEAQQELKTNIAIAGGLHQSFARFQHIAVNNITIGNFSRLRVNEILEIIKDNETSKVKVDEPLQSSTPSPAEAYKEDPDSTKLVNFNNFPNILIYLGTLFFLIILLFTLSHLDIVFLRLLQRKDILYSMLFVWLLIPPIWFYSEPKSPSELPLSVENLFSIIKKRNFNKAIWICGIAFLLTLLFEIR